MNRNIIVAEYNQSDCLNERIGVLILPFYEDGDLLVVARRGLDRQWNLEFPNDAVEMGESPDESAIRVFLQQTGMYCKDFVHIQTLHPTFGIYEIVYVFSAERFSKISFRGDQIGPTDATSMKMSPAKIAGLISDKIFSHDMGILAFKKFYYNPAAR